MADEKKSIERSPTHEASINDVELGESKTLEHDADKALVFLKTASESGSLTPELERKLVRKIDWQIVPLMWGCYFLQYLDKTLSQ